MDIQFNNVSIGIEANTPNEAYTILCNALSRIKAKWQTDTYQIPPDYKDRSTTELFPRLE